MPRTARVVIPGAPHHVIQRGNRRQTTFFSEQDYRLYRAIAAEVFANEGVEVWAYCLMPNHVHLIAAPSDPGGLARAMGAAHLRYTRVVNRREGWTGFLWQGRFVSFPMDETYLLQCARYIGLNPVRAGLVRRAVEWPWSSVRSHLEGGADKLLTAEPMADRLGAALGGFFDVDVEEEARRRFRAASTTGSPAGRRSLDCRPRTRDRPQAGRRAARAANHETPRGNWGHARLTRAANSRQRCRLSRTCPQFQPPCAAAASTSSMAPSAETPSTWWECQRA